MAQTTFMMKLAAGAWTLIADGAAYNSVGVQLTDGPGIKLALAGSSPSNTTDDFIMVGANGERSFSIDLDSASKLYGMAMSGATEIRGFRKAP